jgi:hypothetical protein
LTPTHLPPTETPPATATLPPTPDLLGTITAIGPAIEVTWDGERCTMSGSSELNVGEQAIAFNNLSGESAYIWVSWHYPGRTWEAILHDMGTPGSDITPSGLGIMAWDHSLTIDSRLSYRVYTFTRVAEYDIVVEGRPEHFWPCGPFNVVATP